MTFFGWTLIRTRTLDTIDAAIAGVDARHAEELDHWKAKYYYAKARALVAERFRNPTITVRPRMVHDFETETIIKSVEVEVGIRPADDRP